MIPKALILPLAAVALLLAACDNDAVSRSKYDALMAERDALAAENDSLQFELSCLKDYVEYLEEDNKELVEELNSIPLIEE